MVNFIKFSNHGLLRNVIEKILYFMLTILFCVAFHLCVNDNWHSNAWCEIRLYWYCKAWFCPCEQRTMHTYRNQPVLLSKTILNNTNSYTHSKKQRCSIKTSIYHVTTIKLCKICCCCCFVTKLYLTLMNAWTVAPRLLCLWNFPGKNNGVGCHSLLQGIFSTKESNQHLLHLQVDSLSLSHQGSPIKYDL